MKTKNNYEVIGDKLRVFYRHGGYFECSADDLEIVKMATWHDSECGPRGRVNGKDRFLRDFISIKNWNRFYRRKDPCQNKITEENGYLKVWFTNGDGFFICDKKDLDIVLKRTWYKSKSSKYGYAACRIDGKFVCFHRIVCKCEKGEEVDHINRNSLDNRRSNLRSVTHRENLLNRDSSAWNRLRKRESVES